LKKDGTALILGAGGPMGRMHSQRALESKTGPSFLVASDVDTKRLNDLKESFGALSANDKNTFIVVNPVEDAAEYKKVMNQVNDTGGFDDIEVMVTNLSVIDDISGSVAQKGMINLFAGLKRGTFGEVNASLIFGSRQARFIGHSGSKLKDQIAIVERFKNSELEPRRSVAAICGLKQIAEGIQAMIDSKYPGKIVVYPMIVDYPLTGLGELKNRDPDVYSKLEGGRFWTGDAERLFLEKYLK
jgi:threonine dehydrogenase-like Zn-dependent dehydrogenase